MQSGLTDWEIYKADRSWWDIQIQAGRTESDWAKRILPGRQLPAGLTDAGRADRCRAIAGGPTDSGLRDQAGSLFQTFSI